MEREYNELVERIGLVYYQNDPFVYNSINYGRMVKASVEETMVLLVRALVDDRQRMVKELIERMSNEKPRPESGE